MNTHVVSRRLLWRGLVIAMFLMLVLPAHAAPQGKKFQTDTTTSTETTQPSTGDINPTSAPAVDDDFAGLELTAVKMEPTLLDTADLTVYTDEELRIKVNAPFAQEFAQGAGLVVAVLDSGFGMDHPAVAANLVPGGWDFVDDDPDPMDYGNGIDDDKDGWMDRGVGHGTMVAAMVLSAAPRAGILPLRVRDDEGRGGDKPLLLAIEYAIDLGVDVINLSVDDDIYDVESVRWIIAQAKYAGIVVVAAAGNDGLDYLPEQAITEANLVVGAVDFDDTVAPFSNYSVKRNLAQMIFAPGVELLGPMVGEGYYTRGKWSGTSFSAGVVSGAAALLRELHPSWDPWDIQAVINQNGNTVCLADGTRLKKVRQLDLLQVVEAVLP